MWMIVSTSVACLALGSLAVKVSSCRKNYGIAKSSGFPVRYSPVHITDFWWLLLYPLLVPFVRLIPTGWQEPWVTFSEIWSIWKRGHQPFKSLGSDTVLLATPKGNMLWSCEASVVEQIFTQHGKTQIPVDLVKFYDFWGPTLGSVEGDEWRRHRRIVTAGFNPGTNDAVWRETISQTGKLVDHWVSEEGSLISVMKTWTSRLALHVISGVFFDRHLEWKEYTFGKSRPNEGHRISFEEALFTIVARMGLLTVFPKNLLRILPVASLNQVGIAYDEWTNYLQELRENALARLDSIAGKRYKTILESLVFSGTPKAPTKAGDNPLAEESVLGNIFFLLFTGHETTGNTMAFIMLLLAIYPEYQQKVQTELDHQLAGRSRTEWVIADYSALQAGMVGAVQKEVLRLYSVVQFIPRITTVPTTVIDSKGVSHVIPTDTLCLLNFPAAFRNDEVWEDRQVPQSRLEELHRSPAVFFDPSRWLRKDAVDNKEVVPSWYWPFGIGARSCPGKAFAQTEMTAAMASIFSDYSLELVIGEKTMGECGGDQSKAWSRTRDQAMRSLIDDIESNVNIMLLKDLPIRLVKRQR